jgi:putative Mg2+ transporter-C (MgtC) family protein
MFQTDLNILVRLLISLILSGLLGWEREQSGKAAGLRTHMLVGMGATLFVVLGELFVFRFQTYNQNMQFDPIRIVEAVVAGVSFLGAGTIFLSHTRDRIRGLTTAASIWITAAVGMIVGVERYWVAVGSTLLIFVVLHLLNRLDRH